jgi:hypothetical protein
MSTKPTIQTLSTQLDECFLRLDEYKDIITRLTERVDLLEAHTPSSTMYQQSIIDAMLKARDNPQAGALCQHRFRRVRNEIDKLRQREVNINERMARVSPGSFVSTIRQNEGDQYERINQILYNLHNKLHIGTSVHDTQFEFTELSIHDDAIFRYVLYSFDHPIPL